MLKRFATVLVLGTALFSAAPVAAQGLPAPPSLLWPARQMTPAEMAYYGPATKGFQIIGDGNRCMTTQSLTPNAPLTMESCVANLITQRFTVMVQGAKASVRLATNIVATVQRPLPPNLPPGQQPPPSTMQTQVPGCITANDNGEFNLDVCNGRGIHPDRQNWLLKPPVIQSGAYCLDVKDNVKSLGARLIAWRCHGGVNQSWRLTQNYGPMK